MSYWRDGKHDWVSIADLGTFDKYVSTTKERISDLAVAESGIKAAPANTVLMSFKLSIGKVAITRAPVFTNEAIMSLVDRGKYQIDPTFIYHQCKAKDWTAGSNAAVMGKTLNKKTLGEASIYLPDFDSQIQIAAELDYLDEQISLANAATNKLDYLIKSRFNEMFEGVKQPVIAFGDCCIHLRNGANIKQDKGASGIPITRIETLSNGKFNLDKMGFANIFSIDSYAKHRLLPGDILISHINSIAYLGRAVQYRGELGDSPVIHGMNLLSARLKETFSPTYFEWFFKTPQVSKYISSIAKKSVNQASFSVTDLKKMPIAIPPISSQLEFATFVQRVDKLRFMLLRNPSPTYRGRSFCCSTNSGNSGVILDA